MELNTKFSKEEKIKDFINSLDSSLIYRFFTYSSLCDNVFYDSNSAGFYVCQGTDISIFDKLEELEKILLIFRTQRYIHNQYKENPITSIYCSYEESEGFDLFQLIAVECKSSFEESFKLDIASYPIIQEVYDNQTKKNELILRKRLLASIVSINNGYRIFTFKDKKIKQITNNITFHPEWVDSFPIFLNPLRIVFPRDNRGDIKVVNSKENGYAILYVNKEGNLDMKLLQSFEKCIINYDKSDSFFKMDINEIVVPERVLVNRLVKKGRFYYQYNFHSNEIRGSNNWRRIEKITAEYDFRNFDTIYIKANLNEMKL